MTHVVGVGNGTDAITIALIALGVGPGDDVVVPSFTFYASAEAIPHTGARPVFCDVDPETLLRHAPRPSSALSPRPRAQSSPLHLFGTPAPLDELRALARRARHRRARGRRPGRRRAARRDAGRRARGRRDVQLLSIQEPLLPRRRRRDRDRDDATSRSRRGCCAHTARATSRRSRWSGSTRASTRFRRRSLRASLERLDELERHGAARSRRPTPRRASASHVRCRADPHGAEPVHHLYVDAARTIPTRWPRGSIAPGIDARSLLRRPSTASRRWRPRPPAPTLPGTERAAPRISRSRWAPATAR